MFVPGQSSEQEGENIYGLKSQTGIQILFLVYHSNPSYKRDAVIRYRSINEFSTNQTPTKDYKLQMLANHDFNTIFNSSKTQSLTLNSENKWFNHADKLLITNRNYFLDLLTKSNDHKTVFCDRTNGNLTSRDSWCLNFDIAQLKTNMHKTIDFYNQQLTTLENDPHQIKWSTDLYKKARLRQVSTFDPNCLTIVQHRPFCQTHLYYSPFWNERCYRTRRLFSFDMKQNRSRVIGICVTQQGGRLDVLAVQNHLIGLHFIEAGKFYPLYTFRKENDEHQTWTATSNITTFCRRWVQTIYPHLSDQTLFAYIYGILHSLDYKKSFKNFLINEPPRFCLLKNRHKLLEFAKIGQKLLNLHLKYETIPIHQWYACQEKIHNLPSSAFKLNQRGVIFAKNPDRSKNYTTIIYNQYITLQNIPLQVYQYQLNGRSVVEQFMNFYRFKKDKVSGIENNPNEFLKAKQPDYFLTTLLRIIALSLKTQALIKQLPHVNFNLIDNLVTVPTT